MFELLEPLAARAPRGRDLELTRPSRSWHAGGVRPIVVTASLVVLGACTPKSTPAEPADDRRERSEASEQVEPPEAAETSAEPLAHELNEAPAVEPGESDGDCDPRAIAAAGTALTTAKAEGVAAEHLADCRPEDTVCGRERGPTSAKERCQLIAYHSSDRWEILVVPKPATGAPTRLEIWLDEAGEQAGRKQISGSTWGVVEGVIIEGRGLHRSHSHGGAPASVGGARFVVHNHRDQPVDIELRGTRWLTANSCELPREERSRPKPAGLAIGEGLIDGDMRVTIPAGAREVVHIGYAVQDAYMVHCDRFATAAEFHVDGEKLEVIAEHRVVRRTPMRGP